MKQAAACQQVFQGFKNRAAVFSLLNLLAVFAAMPVTDTNSSAPDSFAADDFLQTLLNVSLAGLFVLRPVFGADEHELVDLAYVRVSPAAQRMLQVPEHPAETFLQMFPHAAHDGVFNFYRDTFLSGEVNHYGVAYEHNGVNNYYQLAAQRSGPYLLVSFTDTGDESRRGVELGLRATQAREQAARTTAETQRNQLHTLVDQAPVALGFFEGPELRITAVNQQMSTIWGYPVAELAGRPLLEAVPELQGQGFDDLLRQVLATQVPFVGTEVPAQLLRDGRLQTTYFNFVYKPLYDAQGTVLGVVDVAVEVTEQVVARQQLQALTEELLSVNQELEAATTAVEKARAGAELQRRQLRSVLEQAPAIICVFDGPQHVFQFVNDAYQALVGERPLLGRPLADALPEPAGPPRPELLDQVYQTGETHHAPEVPVQLARADAGAAPSTRYYNFTYQARHNQAGAIDGVLVFAYDATAQVVARQQMEDQTRQLREALARANEKNQAHH